MADVSHLSIFQAPNKTTYRAGDKFEKYGMIVKVHYTDGTSANVDFFTYSPTSALTTSDTLITISAFEKTITQSISVLPAPSSGYFIDKYLGNATYGNNPYINTADGSISFYNNPITVERDSYAINLILSYHSRMTDKESDLITGFFKGFRTNYHQFLIQDGVDSNNVAIYKYIDGNGYIHTFTYRSDISEYRDEEGQGLSLDLSSRTITDLSFNELEFDTSGRLIAIRSGVNLIEDKRITYSSDGIRTIYDNRNPNTYIKFSYNFSFLQYIRVYYNSMLIKTYTFYGFFGQITSIDETVGNNTRTLYQYSVNDRDRINRIIDCLTKESYRITYDFDSVFNDYRFSSLRNGYMEDNTFVQQKGIYLISRSYDASLNNKLIYEMIIRNDSDKDLSLMTDSNGQLISVFEYQAIETKYYFSLKHDVGIYVDAFSNVSYADDYISSSQSVVFSNQITVNQGLNSSDLGSSAYIKLIGYIKIKSHLKRAKLYVTGSNISCRFKDINPDAYNIWQYFEIQIDRVLDNSGTPKAFSSFSVSLFNENSAHINAEICNLQFAKSEPREKLFFLNDGSPICFDDINRVRYQKPVGGYEEINICDSSTRMSESDLLLTIKFFYVTWDDEKYAFFNGGKTIKKYLSTLKGKTPSNEVVSFFSASSCDNSVLGTNKNWFFASSIDAPIKTYYRFDANYYEKVIRKTVDNNSFKDTIYRYDYYDRLILEINERGSEIRYQYFVDGNLKKKTLVYYENNVQKTVVLYEATKENNSEYINRIVQEGKSVDYQFNNEYLLKRKINNVSQNQVVDTGYAIEQSYDSFLSDLSNVSFKDVDLTLEEHNYSRPSTSYKTNYVDDTVSKYRIKKNISDRTTVLGVHNGSSYVDVLTVEKSLSYTKKTYNNKHTSSQNYQEIKETYDGYNRLSEILFNNNIMVNFYYDDADNCASKYNGLLMTIIDDFSSRTIDYSYDDNNDVYAVQIGYFFLYYSVEGDYKCVEAEYSSSEKYLTKIGEDKAFTSKSNSEINSAHWEYSFDNLLRVSSKTNNKYSPNIVQEYSYSSDYPSKVSGYSFKGNTYQEFYYYGGILKNLTTATISFANQSSYISYEYDGFGRLISESNSLLNVNRTYVYKPDDNTEGPVGRMISFGNISMTYDERGRLTGFGNNTYGYDEYGNRISKNSISYQWTRGRLLSNLGLNSFVYDYKGIRTEKCDGDGYTHIFYYNDTKLVGEDVTYNNNVVRKLRFFYDKDGLCALRTIIGNETKDYIYIRNPFNDIVGISEGNTIKAYYVYDAWGNHKIYNPDGTLANLNDSTFIGNINPFRYRSYYYDIETNLYYLMSRYYDPEIGQFISPDDMEYMDFNLIAGINLYAYCNNNPVMNYDPDGNSVAVVIFIILAIIAFNATISDIKSIKNLKVKVENDIVTIKNSYQIVTPWVQMFYSAYLKYFHPEAKNVIKGSLFGVQFEWITHNIAYYIGLDTISSEELDLSRTIFANQRPVIEFLYSIFYPIATTLFVPWPFNWLVYFYDVGVS